MKPNFRVVRAEGARVAELQLYDVIGHDWWSGGGVSSKSVIDALAALADCESIDVRINSPGGDASEGVAIYNALARFAGRVVVHVDAMAASIASLIAMAGDEIRTAENALWMVHQPWTGVAGDASEMRRVADVLDRYWSSMLTTYSRRTGMNGAEVTRRVAAGGGEWWMTAAEAVEAGFSDVAVAAGVEASSEVAIQASWASRFRRAPARVAASATAGEPARDPIAEAVLEEPRRLRVAAGLSEREQAEIQGRFAREHRVRRARALSLLR